MAAATAASRPEGARIRTGAACLSVTATSSHQSSVLTLIGRDPGQNPAELDETLTHAHTTAVNAEFPNGVLVRAGPLLDHRGSAPDLPARLEEPQQQNGVAEVG